MKKITCLVVGVIFSQMSFSAVVKSKVLESDYGKKIEIQDGMATVECTENAPAHNMPARVVVKIGNLTDSLPVNQLSLYNDIRVVDPLALDLGTSCDNEFVSAEKALLEKQLKAKMTLVVTKIISEDFDLYETDGTPIDGGTTEVSCTRIKRLDISTQNYGSRVFKTSVELLREDVPVEQCK